MVVLHGVASLLFPWKSLHIPLCFSSLLCSYTYSSSFPFGSSTAASASQAAGVPTSIL